MGAPLIARRQNIMTAYGTTNQSAGPNTTINLNSSIASGNKLKLLNNAIVIGPGISKVKVTGNIFYQDFPSSQAYLWGRIYKNTNLVSSTLEGKGNTTFQSCPIPPKIIEVTEGDKITLNTGDINDHTVTIRAGEANTYLTVEVIE